MKVRKVVSIFSYILFVISFSNSVNAAPVSVSDDYIGALPTHPSWVGKDIVGSQDQFSVESVSVNFAGAQLSIEIFSTYFDNVGRYFTELGDFFISVDGWSPFGAAPYTKDNAANGESWEYALVLDNHGEKYSGDKAGYSMLGESGDLGLFAIPDSSYIEMSSAPQGYIYRAGQEVQLNTRGLAPISLGSWSIFDLAGGVDKLVLTIDASGLPINNSEWGFHWAMSCANDAIEGSFPVAEPMTLLLLGAGLSGLGLSRRRRYQSK